jgi:hypothetical protein
MPAEDWRKLEEFCRVVLTAEQSATFKALNIQAFTIELDTDGF